MFEQAIEAFGRVDIMVNNAGIITQTPIVDMSVADWNRIFEVNVVGTFLGCREAAKQMIAQGSGGRIINGSSIAGRRGLPLLSAYGASKSAIIAIKTLLHLLCLTPFFWLLHLFTSNALGLYADSLDPALPWTGWKDSGRGVSLSALGFDALTRPKAIHFRLNW